MAAFSVFGRDITVMASTATISAPVFDRETLLAAARERTGLSDFGDTWFFEPMNQYIAAANAEGKLTQAGFPELRLQLPRKHWPSTSPGTKREARVEGS